MGQTSLTPQTQLVVTAGSSPGDKVTTTSMPLQEQTVISPGQTLIPDQQVQSQTVLPGQTVLPTDNAVQNSPHSVIANVQVHMVDTH